MFASKPLLRYVGPNEAGRALYILAEDLVFHIGLDGNRGSGITVTVPAGIETDLASVPRPLRWLFPPDGPWQAAAVLHDHLYTVPGCSRFLADALLREAMSRLGIPLWQRVIMYYAVRLFGGSYRRVG
ncbi:unnamed protein product [marine sediment metagenome]|uniref:DUF1353 domain-containing protein n=1 Tax=marine sediment metagenome TaxID=412755 RepID=X1AH47_9ZZZZ